MGIKFQMAETLKRRGTCPELPAISLNLKIKKLKLFQKYAQFVALWYREKVHNLCFKSLILLISFVYIFPISFKRSGLFFPYTIPAVMLKYDKSATKNCTLILNGSLKIEMGDHTPPYYIHTLPFCKEVIFKNICVLICNYL